MEPVPLTSHLKSWTPTHAIEARNAVRALVRHEGWAYFEEALELYEEQLLDALLTTSPTDEGARYAEQLGSIQTVRAFQGIPEGVLRHGDQAEQALREPVPA